MPRAYLDNAATSWPKPDAVYDAVDRYQRQAGAAVGRGAYRSGLNVQAVVDRCRHRAAELLGAERPERIVFTFNGTDGLNTAIHGVLQTGDHVVTTVVEHNSVLRPLRELERRLGIAVTRVSADRTGRVEPAAIREALRPETKLVAVLHASNVTGTIQPIGEIGEIVRQTDALFLVDAAQTAGHLPLDLHDLPVDLLACSGHKGLLGPLGTGLLYLRPGVEERVRSFRQGGTGSKSEDDRQPETMPDKYESGNHNAPGLVGLEAGLEWLQEQGLERLRGHELETTALLLEGLRGVGGLTVHGPGEPSAQVGVVSVSVDGFDPHDLASILDQSFGIECRAGLHCAPGAHRAIGSFDGGGTVRLSVGPFTTAADVEAALAAFREVAG